MTTHKKTPDLFESNLPALRVALCQIETEAWAVEQNLARTLAALEKAKQGGAELAITPECVLHGYASGSGPQYVRHMLAVAERLDGAHVSALRAAARDLVLDLVVGFAERGTGDTIHNSAVLITRTGTLAAVYRKVHCRPFESVYYDGVFTPGDEFSVSTLEYDNRRFRLGILICFDREIPESVRCLRKLGAELVACPLACDTSNLQVPLPFMDNEVLTRARAAENEVFIAVVNHAGRFNGGSFVVGPGGETLVQLGAAPEVRVVTVPVGVVPARFHNQPLGWLGFGYRRPEVYRKYLFD